MNGSVFIFCCLVSGLFTLLTVLRLAGVRPFPGRRELMLIFASLSLWCFGYMGELLADSGDLMRLWLKAQYPGIAFLPAWTLLFALRYCGFGRLLSRGAVRSFLTLSSLTLLLNLLYPVSRLFYRQVAVERLGSLSLLSVSPGPWYWVHIAYFYSALLTLALLMLRHLWRRGPLYRTQIVWIFAALLIPVAGNLLYMSGQSPWGRLDLTPVSLSVTGMLMISGMRRSRLFDVVPVARDLLVEAMRDGVVVADDRGRVVDINPAARNLLGSDAATPGALLEAVLPAGGALSSPGSRVLESGVDGERRWLEIRHLDLPFGDNASSGSICLLRDITEEKTLENQREELIRELRDALSKVEELETLIPICAHCKKIRDDEGYWNQLEVYLKHHARLQFSHGICPECFKEMCGE